MTWYLLTSVRNKRLAEFHEWYWDHGDRRATHAHCLTCAQRQLQIMCHPRWHLDQALLHYTKERRGSPWCCGREHADVRKIWDKIEQLERVQIACDASLMHTVRRSRCCVCSIGVGHILGERYVVDACFACQRNGRSCPGRVWYHCHVRAVALGNLT
jgi:hypothetical protein